MHKLKLALFIFVFPIFSASVLAQDPSDSARDPEIQKFLNTPVWYFNYRITIKAIGEGGERQRWKASLERVTKGTMKLGLRSQGPSLSMQDLIPTLTTPEAMDNLFGNYVNWISGLNIDESKSDAENDALIQQTVMENFKAHGHYAFDYYGESQAVCGGSTGPCGNETHRQYGEGHADVSYGGNFGFEIDGEHKRFNLLFDFQRFTGTEQSANALVGESISNEGTNIEERQPFEMGLHIPTEEIVSIEPPMANGPMGANIVGNLPSTYAPISGSSLHHIEIQHGSETIPGTLSIQYTFSPDPPALVELLIIPPDDYHQWRPLAGENEKDSGDWVPVKVKLQKPGGGTPEFKAIKFTYRLKDTSREKGICMNAPLNADPDNPFDLQIEADKNPNLLITDQTGQEATETGGDPTASDVIISSFDYGAYGDLEVEATLENHEIVKGVIPGTSEEKLKLPFRKDDSKIADVFVRNLNGYTDKDDNEDDPVGDGYKGDGISLYEEYRGFMNGKKWVTGDPNKKDVFVYNEIHGALPIMRGIAIFKKATGLVVHKDILKSQVKDDMVINFNYNAETHLAEDQHVIHIQSAAKKSQGGSAHVEEIGTPGTAKSVNIPPDWEDFRVVQDLQVPSKERTTAHEMSHDVNIYHHGEKDTTEHWFLVGDPPQLFAREVYFDDVSRQYVDVTRARMEITVMLEDGTVLSPRDVIAEGDVQRHVGIGENHGQHSGAEDCLMRYWVAHAYKSNSNPNVRYLSPGEFRGTTLCTTANGTGVNESSRTPQSRYSSAATPANGGPEGWVEDNRGNCFKQIRVNDIGEEPAR